MFLKVEFSYLDWNNSPTTHFGYVYNSQSSVKNPLFAWPWPDSPSLSRFISNSNSLDRFFSYSSSPSFDIPFCFPSGSHSRTLYHHPSPPLLHLTFEDTTVSPILTSFPSDSLLDWSVLIPKKGSSIPLYTPTLVLYEQIGEIIYPITEVSDYDKNALKQLLSPDPFLDIPLLFNIPPSSLLEDFFKAYLLKPHSGSLSAQWKLPSLSPNL